MSKRRKATKAKDAATEKTAAPASSSLPPVPAAELERIFSLYSRDPHAVLGSHPLASGGGRVVRAYRPDAERVELLVEGRRTPVEMSRAHPRGLFEAVVARRKEAFLYQLRVHYPSGAVFTQRDAYAYLPTFDPLDEHLFGEGRHERIYRKLGAHVRDFRSVGGVSFAVWAPHADGVSVVGSFNDWDGRLHQMRQLGSSGVWEIFVPDIRAGALYKFEIRRRGARAVLKADPYAQFAEVPPATSSIVFESSFEFTDGEWIARRESEDHLRKPLSIYEVHLGSWRRVMEEEGRSLTYRETAPALADYCERMGFTHVEFLPLKGHPYGGSWGYQVANYYAPTARYGDPDDLRFLINYLHTRGLGVIMDWVPAHFPKDAWALGRFDGSALYEHLDPRMGEHPDWGTYIFNYGRNEVKNFLVANALYWIDECHIDGLRVDAVASMLYLDYSREEGQWLPNKFGGRENLEALDFIRELNETVHRHRPGVMMIAEESTSWPLVTRPPEDGGLGFNFKWNMGWMHDTLKYFQTDPLYRRGAHHNLTFGLVYAWSENFILPFSHDEVVHMKGSMLNKMHGDRWQKFANLRALYAYMWAHPGKKLLFMGGEVAQWREWSEEESVDWHLLDEPEHASVQRLIGDLNRLYRDEPALYEADSEPTGFEWLDVDNAPENVVAFARVSPSTGRRVICVGNFSPVARPDYRLGLPHAGTYKLLLNTDAARYGGTGTDIGESFEAEDAPHLGRPYSATVALPPLAALWLEAPPAPAVVQDEAASNEIDDSAVSASFDDEDSTTLEVATPVVNATPDSDATTREAATPDATTPDE
ncbi:MAG TPA: 1,4-alpha-glucan branching protein GlgB [Pyrinomonadaceae bacterium]|nr:1,4-alpha-glucan branching protein GlgB [Pyrinomonadaceae bacterium]